MNLSIDETLQLAIKICYCNHEIKDLLIFKHFTNKIKYSKNQNDNIKKKNFINTCYSTPW